MIEKCDEHGEHYVPNMNLVNAMMLLEIAGDFDIEKRYGITTQDAIWSAHSFVQFVENGHPPSKEAIKIIAKIQADSAIDNARFSSKLKGDESA
jgi:hypothetical protein